MSEEAKREWESYREDELRRVTPLLEALGYELLEEQVHIGGERFLMAGERDVGGGGYKLVLLGKGRDGNKVVIKVSSTREGKAEIALERRARETVRSITFAYESIAVPRELLYTTVENVLIFLTEYITQDSTFLSRPLKEQFAFSLSALKSQESFHATTSSHARQIQNVFGVWNTDHYINCFSSFIERSVAANPENVRLRHLLEEAGRTLIGGGVHIEQYTGFLSHADFVPHNFRIKDNVLYLLDSASLHFGNKYESWARFLNFMLLHNRPLEEALLSYVAHNRTSEENISLRLMRIYKLGKLLEYHTSSLSKASGDLRALAGRRVTFWCDVLDSLLKDSPLSDAAISSYQADRDRLRSTEERKRQAELH